MRTAAFLLALWGSNMSSAPAEIRVTFTPAAAVRETGQGVTVVATFANELDRPVVMLETAVRNSLGAEQKKELFLGLSHRSKAAGDFYHCYNLLAPGDAESIALDTPGTPGQLSFEFQLDYIVADDDILGMPVYDMVKQYALKRNRPEYASLAEFAQYTEQKQIGTLSSVWHQAKARSEQRLGILPYFVEVSPTMTQKARVVRASYVLQVQPDPAITQLHRDHPEVTVYRSAVPHFGLAYIMDDLTYARDDEGERELGRVSFDALELLGTLLVSGKPIRLSVGRRVQCLKQAFGPRIQADDRVPGQAWTIGQGLPSVVIAPAELDVVWQCMVKEDAAMVRSQYYDYLVVDRWPRARASEPPGPPPLPPQ